MSIAFYDHILHLDRLSAFVASLDIHKAEKEELWHLVDEILHHRVLGFILDKLPEIHHEEFLEKLANNPSDHSIITYLKDLIEGDIEELLSSEIATIEAEITELITVV